MSDGVVRYGSDHRAQAAADGKVLCTIDYEGRPGKVGGRMTYQGAVPKDVAERAWSAALAVVQGWDKPAKQPIEQER